MSDCIYLVLLIGIVSITWCAHYQRWSIGAWKTPIDYIGARTWDMTYAGDGLWGLAATKLMADGEISFWDKRPASLGAPFGANWNDWPSIEEGVNAWWALLARIFGLGNGSNLAALSAHLLAGITFYLVCRYLKYRRIFSLVGGTLFALSRFAFWRSLPNLSLTFYWHLPLGFLVAWWCTIEQPVQKDRKKLLLCVLTPILFGIQSPYYSGLFLQLLIWAALLAFLRSRDWRSLILPSGMGALLFATLVLVNLDTLSSHAGHGFNSGVVHRWYSDLEKYALKPVELVLPRSHSLASLQEWSNEVYFKKTLVSGEIGSSYLGVVAVLAAGMLAFEAARLVARGSAQSIPIHFWGIVMVVSFSIVGGFNGLAGLWGIWLFRASNRYSIAILMLLLLFLVKKLSTATRDWSRLTTLSIASLTIGLGIYDQVPPGHHDRENTAQKVFRDDRRLVAKMEEALPGRPIIFQVPVFPFPEGSLEQPITGTMDDYEQFRPFIHSSNTFFSYGGTKGRYEGQWQKEAEEQGTNVLVRTLEKYGFNAILLNREGYDDRGVAMLTDLQAAGARNIVASSDDFVCLELNPARRPLLPPVFREGWFNLEVNAEGNRRLCTGDGILSIYNRESIPKVVRLSFGLEPFRQQRLEISSEKRVLYQTQIAPGEFRKSIDVEIKLEPGRNDLRFTSDPPGQLLGNGDPRKLAFGLLDFRVAQ